MAFSASDAAVEGFRIARREPKAIAAWSVVQLIFGVVLAVATMPFARSMAAMQSIGVADRANPAAVMAKLEPSLGFIGAIIPLELVLLAVLSAAVYRVVLRPEEKGLARLKLGADELRLGILWIELGLFLAAVGFLALIPLTMVFTVLGVAAKAAPENAIALLSASYLVLLALYAWLGVRFSLAGPLTFARREVRLFSAWRLTKGRFWPLFGCYLLTFIFMLSIGMVQLCVEGVVALAMSGGNLAQAGASIMHPDYTSLQSYFSPARVVILLFNAALGGIYWSVAWAPAALAYKEIVGVSPPAQA
ncbi:MAG TPA: hypothetical protein VIJ94_12800 [Caulobacteraceae bacterium]